ncbi:MAG: TetR/AcrR family transcriptional regulator [Flexilinea sp.]|nr:TetR/AcrR family transcriptional regulator [Flexilinea sp.]
MRIVKSAEKRKSEILDVAEQLFAEKGFDNASTNDIINRIGIARGTLYHHFKSKEEILDAIVERMTREKILQAEKIIENKNIPILERLTLSYLSLNVDSKAGAEVLEQMHKPQNALLHQKMQESVISGVVPLMEKLITEGNESGIFDTKYPANAAEMIITYSNTAFDDLAGLTLDEMQRKRIAFIYHTERILGAKEGSLEAAIMKIFTRQ